MVFHVSSVCERGSLALFASTYFIPDVSYLPSTVVRARIQDDRPRESAAVALACNYRCSSHRRRRQCTYFLLLTCYGPWWRSGWVKGSHKDFLVERFDEFSENASFEVIQSVNSFSIGEGLLHRVAAYSMHRMMRPSLPTPPWRRPRFGA